MMCELLAMSSGVPATVNLALNVFARHGGGDGPDKDGWGIAYYEDGDVRLIKDAAPAFDSPWIGFVEGLSLRSTLVLAHIRRASRGDVAFRNTHPFMRELGGRPHVFAHNGSVPGIFNSHYFPLDRFHPLGETDSESAFCALMDRIAQSWARQGGIPTLEERTRIVADFATQLRREGPANFLYADGDVVFLHGDRRKQHADALPEWPGLHFLVRHNQEGRPFLGAGGVKVEGVDHPVLLVASVPLTDERWTPLSEGEVLVASKGKILSRVRT
jgi:glutamine amidotransferase